MIEPSGWRVRQTDHAFLTSREAPEILHDEGIIVIDYQSLQHAWRAEPRFVRDVDQHGS